MKISLLLKREPFREIFEATAATFLTELNNSKTTVKWLSNRDSLSKGKQIWYCNPLINSIFVKGVNNKVFNSIMGEYSTNPLRPWLSLPQKLYLFFATNSLTAHLLAKYKLQISPNIPVSEYKLFLGGNTKIRFLDINNRKVYVILKCGYKSSYINQEIEVRKSHKFLPAPQLFEISKNCDWYCEEYINGVSPDRIKKDIYLIKAIASIQQLYRETKFRENKHNYLTKVKNSIESNMEVCSALPIKISKKIKNIVNTLVEKLSNSLPFEITVSQVHGDFQPGNIICDIKKNKFWIVDWEHTRVRQITFDYFTLVLGARSTKFNLKLHNVFYNGLNYSDKEYAKMWDEFDYNSINTNILLFILEELDFKIEEQTNIKHNHDNLLTFVEIVEDVINN